MRDLARELREHVDNAPQIALTGITTRRPGRANTRLLAGLAALVVLVTVVATIAVTRTHPDGHASRVETTSPRALPASCFAAPGCPMSPTVAATYLGFVVRVPSEIPAGWVQVRANLRVYLPGSQPGGLPKSRVLTYVFGWAPRGTDIYASGCPTSIFVHERLAQPGDPASGGLDLGNGRLVSGSISDAVCGNPGGPRGTSADLYWADHGVNVALNSWDVGRQQILDVARSLVR